MSDSTTFGVCMAAYLVIGIAIAFVVMSYSGPSHDETAMFVSCAMMWPILLYFFAVVGAYIVIGKSILWLFKSKPGKNTAVLLATLTLTIPLAGCSDDQSRSNELLWIEIHKHHDDLYQLKLTKPAIETLKDRVAELEKEQRTHIAEIALLQVQVAELMKRKEEK